MDNNVYTQLREAVDSAIACGDLAGARKIIADLEEVIDNHERERVSDNVISVAPIEFGDPLEAI